MQVTENRLDWSVSGSDETGYAVFYKDTEIQRYHTLSTALSDCVWVAVLSGDYDVVFTRYETGAPVELSGLTLSEALHGATENVTITFNGTFAAIMRPDGTVFDCNFFTERFML